jgi:internalin A
MDRDELLRLIDKAAEEGWTELDLSGQGLTELPHEIGQLSRLMTLNLSANRSYPYQLGDEKQSPWMKNRIAKLPPEIGELTNLKYLIADGNRLTSLPPEIGGLTQLRKIYLYDNQLEFLPPEIGELSSLDSAKLSNNKIKNLPQEFANLRCLQYLYLDGNEFTKFPITITFLVNLVILYLGTDVSEGNVEFWEIPHEIGRLECLERLRIMNCGLTRLPLEIQQLTRLRILDLRGNPLPLPPEILAKVEAPQTIIQAWLEYLGNYTRPLNETKLVLVGEGSVGKTSLVKRLLYDTFDLQSEKTEGIAIHRWEVSSERSAKDEQPEDAVESKIRVNVWDFGGQEIMHATHQFFLTKRTLYVLVLDNRYSEAENRIEYWLTLIRSFGGNSPVLVVGNKSDQHALDLDRRNLLATYPTVQAILETSCASGDGIPTLREAIATQIGSMPHVDDPIITTWFEVKAELEAMDANYIPYRRYVELCREKSVGNPDSQRVLLGFLHDLGVVLHFPDPRLETTNILNPEWVTKGVYRILNTRLPFDEQGILTWEMLARILYDEPYQEKRMFIVDMMQKFELCYELPDRKHTYLIPDLLPKETRETGAWDDALASEVHYSVLPGSILTRLIVRMHRHIKDQTVWRTGVLLACEGNEALVRADLSANRIRIRVRGPGGGCRDLLTRIREHLGAIHKSLEGLEVAEKVPVPGYPEIPPVDYRWLRDLERAGRVEFTPPGCIDPISVSELLNGIEPPEARRERRKRGGDTYNFYQSQVGVAGRATSVSDGIRFSPRAPKPSNLSGHPSKTQPDRRNTMRFEQGHALIIGVGSYVDHPEINIPISVTDAQAVQSTLCDPQFCGYPADQITLLHDGQATRDGIRAALRNIIDTTQASDTVTLYYCGHGAHGTDGNYYLTTHDTQVTGSRVKKDTGIQAAELIALLRKIPAKRLLLIFNACHSGELSPTLDLTEPVDAFGDETLPEKAAAAILGSGEGRILITASRSEQKSWIGSGKLSLFTQALVDGLRGKGLWINNNAGYISVFSLYEHVYTEVKEAAAKLSRTQEPELTVLKNVGPFPVALYKGASSLGTFDSQADPLPEESAVRTVDPKISQRVLQKYNLHIENSEVGVIGDHTHIEGGIHFGGKKDS